MYSIFFWMEFGFATKKTRVEFDFFLFFYLTDLLPYRVWKHISYRRPPTAALRYVVQRGKSKGRWVLVETISLNITFIRFFFLLTGQYRYGYAVKQGEKQFHHQRSLNGAMYGCYGFVDPQGKLFITHYLADMAGYRLVNMANPDKKLLQRIQSLG